MKPVAILGCGPAGLMAAHAAAMKGHPVAIFSKPDSDGKAAKSRLGGAQFLHRPIPLINNEEEPDAMITYLCRGDAATYRQKVYGDDPTIPFVSMENVRDGMVQPAWNLQATYDALWEHLSGGAVNPASIGPAWVQAMVDANEFETIISTVPLPSICLVHNGFEPGGCSFYTQKITIAPECIDPGLPDNTVLYNGDLGRSWYRASRLFGVGSTEWSDLATRPPADGLVKASKPIRTTCKCWEGDVLRMGRNGTWTKGVLTHDAFFGVADALHSL